MLINELENSHVRDFAESCYDMNSIDELKAALRGGADEVDCKQWEISEDQWRQAVESALAELLAKKH